MTTAVGTAVTDRHHGIEVARQWIPTSDTTGILASPIVPQGGRVIIAGKGIVTSATFFKFT